MSEASTAWYRWPSRLIGGVMIACIRVYQRVLSPLTPPSCRYYPVCSAYAVKAIQVHGPSKGLLLGTWRILRCNPWSKGGIDHVPAYGQWYRRDNSGSSAADGAKPTAPPGPVVAASDTIRDNDEVGSAPTSTPSESSDAVPTHEPEPRVGATPADDVSNNGSVTTDPRQETA
jgi:uncharacterized protein